MSGAVRHEGRVAVGFHPSADYFDSLCNDINGTVAGDRISMLTMDFNLDERYTENVLEALRAATQREVEVNIGVDAYAFMVDTEKRKVGPMCVPLPGQKLFKERAAALSGINEAASGRATIINQPKHYLSHPAAGRSHLKLATVETADKSILYAGGPNLNLTDRADMVISVEDTSTTAWAADLVKTIIQEGTTKTLGGDDIVQRVDDTTSILVDVGKPNQSLILDTAVELAQKADEWITVSGQFFPHGMLAESLATAHEDRGVSTEVFFNSPGGLGIGSWQRLNIAKARRSLPPVLFDNQLPRTGNVLHTAAIASEQAVLKTSHNLVPTGVNLGTAENGVVIRSPEISQLFRGVLQIQLDSLRGDKFFKRR